MAFGNKCGVMTSCAHDASRQVSLPENYAHLLDNVLRKHVLIKRVMVRYLK